MLFVFWIVMAIAVAVAASVKGYNWFLWFIYGFLLWPVALVHVLVRKRAAEIAPAASTPQPPRLAERRAACPFCSEQVVTTAKVCRFCGHELPEGWSTPARSEPYRPAIPVTRNPNSPLDRSY